MGQQQLLLVILVTIIVGIATVVAINTFGSAASSANVDAVRNDLTSMAAAAQAYYIKPGAMGGGGHAFTDITFNDLGSVACDPSQKSDGTASANDATCGNENGDYTIKSISGTGSSSSFDIEGVPAQAGGSVTITVTPNDATMGNYSGS